jgi:diguanylate cyclase (GGDEF)-like protein
MLCSPNADRRRGRGQRDAWALQAGPIGAFFASYSGRLLRFDPVVAHLLKLQMRPAAKRPLTIGRVLGNSAMQALEQAATEGFARADCKLADGRTLLIRARRYADGIRGWVEDVSALRRGASRLQFAASHDALTGLINRRGLYQPLSEIIAVSHRAPATIVFIDLDGFKQINDVFGHAAGDSVLRQFATRLRQALPPASLAARTGGDEFIVVLRDTRLHQADDWIRALQRVVAGQPFRHHEHEFMLRFSAGRAQLAPAMTASLAIHAADLDCAHAKTGRLGLVATVADPLVHLDGEVPEFGLELQAQMVHAAHDQPTPLGAEWLLRLRDRTGKLRLPAEFLPAARARGLASRIDLWVLARALRWLSTQGVDDRANPAPFCVIKLSIESLHDQRFQRHALKLLDAHARCAAGLRFDVSGRLALQDSGSVTEFIDSARTMGVRVVLSGLTQIPVWMPQLSRLLPAAIKVDASWFCDRRDQAAAQSCVRGLIDTCRELDIEACATRIESEQALERAQQFGFDQVQGFLFGPPEPIPLDAVAGLPQPCPNPA